MTANILKTECTTDTRNRHKDSRLDGNAVIRKAWQEAKGV